MARYRHALPQLSGDLFIADGGIETTLIFHDGLTLPDFAAFDLFKSQEGTKALQKYFHTYAALAAKYGVGLILESATWRASSDWAARLGYFDKDLAEANRKAIQMLLEIRDEYESTDTPIVVSGCVGPRGDGYSPTNLMSAEEAQRYHTQQIEIFRDSGADMIAAITMNYVEEALGITNAAVEAGMPVAVSFTVETDGKLPTGQTLRDAIEQVEAATGAAPVYYMINCAHPTHFESTLAADQPWLERIRGVRANASAKSHAELNESTTLDLGNPAELAQQYQALLGRLKNLNVMGGCCGTDHRHIEEICKATLPVFA
jgi:S-methylmethionine-dependent homocysteine/selenocysteine methylase